MSARNPRRPGRHRRALARLLAAVQRDEPVDIDPTRFTPMVGAACRHHVPGLLLEACAALGIDLAEAHRAELTLRASRTAAINLSALRALEPLLAALDAAGIRCILLKGAALLHREYPRPDLRPMTDIDILVAPADARRALAVLEQCGCTPGPALIGPAFFPTYYYEREYFTPPPLRFRLDVHARPLRPQRYARLMPETAMFDATSTLERGTLRLLLPTPEALLIHLAAHAAIHGNDRFIWSYDLLRVVHATATFDEGAFRALAHGWQLTAPVRRGLSAAAELFDDHRLAGLGDLLDARGDWRDRLVLWQAPRDRATPLTHLAVDLVTTPGLGYRLGYIRAVLIPSTEHLAQIYPWRHPGWRCCALVYRGFRRPLARATRRFKPRTFIPA